MLWHDKSANETMTILKEAKTRVRESYVRYVTMLKDFYHGDHESWMENVGDPVHPDDATKEFEGYFEQYFPDAWDGGNGSMLPQYLPLIRRLIDVRTGLFHRKANLPLVRQDGEPVSVDDPQVQTWKDIQEQGKLHPKLKYWDRMTDLCRTTMMHPGWRFGQLDFDVLTPETFFVYEYKYAPKRLDLAPLVMHELSQPLGTPMSDTQRMFVVWERPSRRGEPWTVRVTDIYGRELDDQTLFLTADGKSDPVNRYKRYPYVMAHAEEPTFGIYAELDDSLLMAQVGINLIWTDYHLAMRTQHGGQAVLTVEDKTKAPKHVSMGRGSVLLLQDTGTSGGESFTFANSPLDVAGMIAYLDSFLRTQAMLRGLNPDMFSVNGEQFNQAHTAVAKAMDRVDLQETREDREAYWEMKLKELFEMVKAVWNTHNPSQRFDDDVTIGVEWADIDTAFDPLHEAQAKQAQINANLVSRVDEVGKIYGMDREDAVVKAIQIKDDNELTGAPARQTPAPLDNGGE